MINTKPLPDIIVITQHFISLHRRRSLFVPLPSPCVPHRTTLLHRHHHNFSLLLTYLPTYIYFLYVKGIRFKSFITTVSLHIKYFCNIGAPPVLPARGFKVAVSTVNTDMNGYGVLCQRLAFFSNAGIEALHLHVADRRHLFLYGFIRNTNVIPLLPLAPDSAPWTVPQAPQCHGEAASRAELLGHSHTHTLRYFNLPLSIHLLCPLLQYFISIL